MENFKYILIPLPMLREIYKNPGRAFKAIFNVGIYRVSQTIKINPVNALKQALYCYYRGGLDFHLENVFEQLVENRMLVRDEWYAGFSGYEFLPDQAIESLDICCGRNPELRGEIEEFHRLRQVKEVLNLNFDIGMVACDSRNYYLTYGRFCNEPLISVKTVQMIDYCNRTKTDYEKALWAMYAGIRSIIGNKDYAATTGAMIKCRMFGAKNEETLKAVLKSSKALRTAHARYTTDYHYKKMLKELVARGFLMSEVGFNRRTYVSCKLDMKGLEDAIVEQFTRNKMKQKLKQVEKSRLQSVISIKRRLNNPPA